MLQARTKIKLCEFLILVGQHEQRLESLKQVVNQQQIFEPYASFQRLDIGRKRYLHPNDIQEFLAENGLRVSFEMCEEFIQQKGHESMLSYAEFVNWILPKENKHLRFQVSQKPTFEASPGRKFDNDIEYSLSKLIAQEIEIIQIIQEAKMQFWNECTDFTIRDAFFAIDNTNEGFIEMEKLITFFHVNNYPKIQISILAGVFYRLDSHSTGRIIYEDFDNFFSRNNINFNRHQTFPRERSISIPKNNNNNYEESIKFSTHQQFYEPNQEKYVEQQEQFLQTKQLDSAKKSLNIGGSSRKNISSQKSATKRRSRILSKQQKSSGKRRSQYSQSAKKGIKKSPIVKSPLRQSYNKTKFFEKFEQQELVNQKNQVQKGIMLVEGRELAKTMEQFIVLEQELESLKDQLSLKPEFNIFEFFELFQQFEEGFISINEFQLVMNLLKLYPDKHDLFQFLRRYDTDLDGKLKFEDFCLIFLPCHLDIPKIVREQKHSNIKIPQNTNFFHAISNHTKTLITDLFMIHIENECAAEALRQRLNIRNNFDIGLMFQYFDYDEDGVISESDLKIGLETSEIYLTQQQLFVLFRKFDKNKDGVISFPEFLQELLPTSPKQYL